MLKKVYLFLIIFMALALLNGIPDFVEELRVRGIAGVNYGGIVFPILIGLWAFYKYQKSQ